MQIIEPSVELLWVTPNAAYNVEMATRTAYKSEAAYDPEKSPAFLDRVIKQMHHESVVEHACASFRIITDRGITHEIVRHRLASYTQESTRYVNYMKDKHGAGDIKFIPPLVCQFDPAKMEFAKRAFEQEQQVYNDAISFGFTPQEARDFLPNGVKTEIVMTCNFREWLHFLKLRTAPAAHPKMRVVAKMIAAELHKACPEIFLAPESSP